MTAELVEAWRRWERHCAGARKRRAFSGREGRPEAARLVSAEIAVSIDHDIAHTELHDRIAEGRRDGLSIEEAVARALS